MLKNKKVAWIAAICWMAIIFILSHQPASVSSGLSSGISKAILDLITNILPGFEDQVGNFHGIVRKNAHFIAYFILGILFLNAFRHGDGIYPKHLLMSFTAAVLYAVTDETHQLFIEGRSGEFRDVLIDASGAATGVLFFYAIHLLRRNNKRAIDRKLHK